MPNPQIEKELTEYIVREILVEDEGFVLNPEQPLLDGILDSFGLMSLVTYVEENFDIQVEVSQVTTEHFSSVRALATFVEADLNGHASV